MLENNSLHLNIKSILDKLDILEAPVDVEKVADFFSFKIVRYPKFPDHISGAIIQEKDFKAIGINSNQAQVRQRFTMAHELGHYLLGHDNDAMIDDTFDKPSDKEQEANKFAAELLMPKHFLEKDIKENEWDIPSLAKKYNVSDQAMSIRLLNTGLINKIKTKQK